MKKIFSILSASLAALFFSAGIVSCVDETELIETLDLGACLTPSSTLMNISTEDGRTVTLTWSNSKGATQYVVEIFEGADADAVPENVFEGTPVEGPLVVPAASEGTTTSTAVRLEAGKFYFARVKAQKLDENGNPLSEDSHWATFPYPIEPYLVMDNVPSFTVTERTSGSITVAWEIAEGDTDGVNQIRLTPDPENPLAAYKAFDVASTDRTLTIENLPASTKFTIAAHYNSANRGTVYPWTRPVDDGFTRVASVEQFQQAITDKATQILVEYSDGLVYQMDQMVVGSTSLIIIGEETVDGNKPTIIGSFSLPDGVTDFRAEALSFNGNSYDQAHLISFPSAIPTAINSISVVNCDLTGFKRGLIYAGSNLVTSLGSIVFDNVYMTDTSGDGGEAIGFRSGGGNGTIGSISVTNSTFSDGIREFFRIDNNYTIGSFTFRNNTLNNLGTGANSYGLFYIRAAVSNDFIFSNNLIMNMSDNTAHGVDGRYPWGASAFAPTTVSNNFWYNLGSSDTFFTANFDESDAVSVGGAMLDSDPCVDSPRGIFNVTNSAVLNAQAGDPRWFADYVPAPTPDLVPVEYGYSWTLNDTYTFYDVVDQSTVRGNLKFIIASTPINILDEGMEFSGEATLAAYGGVPTDGAIAFLVNGPGSIYASAFASASGSTNDHITVAVGGADGLTAEVVGSIHVGAENEKIVFDQLEQGTEYLIYLYACGPVVLSTLEWSDDVNTGSTAVADPEVTATPGDGTLSLSWNAVENASGYVISFGVKEPDAEYGEDEYIIETVSTSYTWADFPSGSYTVNVQAIAADPSKNENSQIVAKTVEVTAPALAPMTSGSITEDDMIFLEGVTGGATVEHNMYYKGFIFTGKSGRGGLFTSGDALGTSYFQTGGSAHIRESDPGRTIRFMVAGPGKLTYVACSNNNTDRHNIVAVNYDDDNLAVDNPSPILPATPPTDWTSYTFEEELAVESGDVVDLTGAASINILSVTWTPTGGIESDPDAIEVQTDIVNYWITNYPEPAAAMDIASEVPQTIEKVTYCGKSGKPMQWDGDRIKFQGASDYDEKTVEAGGEVIPEGGYISFKVTKPGTIKHYIRSGNDGDSGRTVRIILVMNDGADIVRLDNFNAPTGSYKEGLEMTTAITEDHLSMTTSTATVYIYSLVNGVNAYYLEYIPD